MVQDADKSETLTDVCLVTACLLAFVDFLQFDELVHIHCCNLTIGQEMVKFIFLK